MATTHRFKPAASVLALLLAAGDAPALAQGGELRLPAFPLPSLVQEQGRPREVGIVRLLRELQKGGLHGTPDLEASDEAYGLLRSDSIAGLTAWLEESCRAFGIEPARAREKRYNGSVLADFLGAATSLASVQENRHALAIPIGTVTCRRLSAWGELPADGAEDTYVLFATEAGMFVYDIPTRQFAALSEFPNKTRDIRIRF